MQFVTAEEVHENLDYPGLVEALIDAHRGPTPIVDHSQLEHHAEGAAAPDNFLVLPAWQPGEAFGLKAVTVMPGNRERPAVQGVVLLFDGKSGAPLAVMDGAAITARKTAGDSAAGASFLARQDSRILLMVGAGAMSAPLIEAHCAIRPAIKQVFIWNRTHEKTAAICEDLKSRGLTVEAVRELEPAARDADIICCATAATSPLIKGEWLKPGCHLDLVGGFRPDMREADDEAVRRANVYVDSRWFTLGRAGDIVSPMKSGAMTEDDIIADLFELSRAEKPGRQSDDEITFFKNAGGSHLDLFTARHLFEKLNP